MKIDNLNKARQKKIEQANQQFEQIKKEHDRKVQALEDISGECPWRCKGSNRCPYYCQPASSAGSGKVEERTSRKTGECGR